MTIVSLRGVGKSFRIPSVRRDTVREHVFGLLHPRRFATGVPVQAGLGLPT